MTMPLHIGSTLRAALALLLAAVPAAAQEGAPADYTVDARDTAAHLLRVEARLPARGRDTHALMMPVWSPGYYKLEDYAARVRGLSATTPAGEPLPVQQPTANHWLVPTRGGATVTLRYEVVADRQFVTGDWLGADYAVLNGAPTFITIAGEGNRPAVVRLLLPAGWRVATALDSMSAPGGGSLRASDYDRLVDSPIAAGQLDVHEFTVAGARHQLVDVGDRAGFDAARAAADLGKIVAQDARFWGGLPYRRYVFLNVFRRGGGGLEHAYSTLLTSSAARMGDPQAYLGWLAFVSHEYLHAFNVKRLRPVELGPFDYEHAVPTPSLWIAEGLTSYFGDLMLTRAGLADEAWYLGEMSRIIGQLQRTPGRLVQTLTQASLEAWQSENSGVGADRANSVSYYTKGPVVGLLLDAHIRRPTGGRRSLDDVMRLAYRRYSGAHGFTPAQFGDVATEVAGADLRPWLRHALDTTEELDYSELLEWYGLRFRGGDEAGRWALEVRPEATAAQRAHLRALVAGR